MAVTNVPHPNSSTFRIPALLLLFLVASADAREPSQRRAFMLSHPCPATGKSHGACPGWAVDHIWPLACGGEDHPRNMQWQTLADAKAKDRWERKMCGKAKQ